MGLISKRVVDMVAENAKNASNAKAVRRLMKLDNMSDEDLEYLAGVMAEIKNIQEIYYLLFEKKLPAKALNIIMEVTIPNVSKNNLGEILSSNRFASNLSDLSQENVKLFMDKAIEKDSVQLIKLIKEKLPNVPDSFGAQPVNDLLKPSSLDKIAESLQNNTFTKEGYCEIIDFLLHDADPVREYLKSRCLEVCLKQDCLPAEKKIDILLYFLSNYPSYIEDYFKTLKFTKETKKVFLEQLFATQNIDLILMFRRAVNLTDSDNKKLIDLIVETNCGDYVYSLKNIMLNVNLSDEYLTKCVNWMVKYADPEGVCECLTNTQDLPYFEKKINFNEEQVLSLLNVLITPNNAKYLIDALDEAEVTKHKIPAEMRDRIVDAVISANERGYIGLSKVANLPYFEQFSTTQKQRLIHHIVANLEEGKNSTHSGLRIIERDCAATYYQLFEFAKKFSNLISIEEKQKIAKILLHDWQMGCYEVGEYLLKESINYSEEFIEELTAHAVSVLDDYFYNSYMKILPKLVENAKTSNCNTQTTTKNNN